MDGVLHFTPQICMMYYEMQTKLALMIVTEKDEKKEQFDESSLTEEEISFVYMAP